MFNKNINRNVNVLFFKTQTKPRKSVNSLLLYENALTQFFDSIPKSACTLSYNLNLIQRFFFVTSLASLSPTLVIHSFLYIHSFIHSSVYQFAFEAI